MKTATRALILASLFGTGCGSAGEEAPGTPGAGTADPTGVAPGVSVPGNPPGAPGVAPTGTPGNPAVPGDTGAAVPGVPPAVPPGPGPDGPATCVAGIPATSQVPRLLNREYDNAIRDLFGLTGIGASQQPPSATLNEDFEGAMDPIVWNAYETTAAAVAKEVVASAKAKFISCDPATTQTCYADSIRTFGRKAFRRPMTDEEVSRFVGLTTLEPAGTPDEIVEALVYAFLVSPSFLMVPEVGAVQEGTAYKLTSYEVATRLSLMLWGTIPDEALNTAADADKLQAPADILVEANRMLQVRDKVAPQVAQAHRAYLVMDDGSHWWKVSHDSSVFPEYSDATSKPALQGELDNFFQEVVYSGGTFKDLYLSNVGFVNKHTAALYDLNPADFGDELVKVDLPNRPGFLTRAGFLSTFSNAEQTSPILRGAFITVNLIGANPGAPDPEAAKTPIPEGNFTTRREQITALTEPESCKTCHGVFVNPPGFALENFDAVGKWQDTDSLSGPIDPSGDVVFGDGSVVRVNNATDLMTAIANDANARHIYAERLVAYATGRLPNSNDACIVDTVDSKLSGDGYTFLSLLADLTQADSFRLRTVGQ